MSQCDISDVVPAEDLPWMVAIDENMSMRRITSGGDTVDAIELSAGYSFRFKTDTTMTHYLLTETRFNDTRVQLDNWNPSTPLFADADSISSISTTEAFPVSTGDEITFYRQLQWNDMASNDMDTSNFHSDDTLDFVVELVDASTDQRLDVLDSLGVLRRASPGTPVLYGDEPLYATIAYEVPSAHNGKSVYLRLKLTQRGNGEYNPSRHDIPTMSMSNVLNDPGTPAFLALYGGYYNGKIIPRARDAFPESDPAFALNAVAIDGGNAIAIEYTVATNGRYSVITYRMDGTVAFLPLLNETEIRTGARLSHTVDASGAYIVALIHNNNLVAYDRVMVRR